MDMTLIYGMSHSRQTVKYFHAFVAFTFSLCQKCVHAKVESEYII